MEEFKPGCVRPTSQVLEDKPSEVETLKEKIQEREVGTMVKVGNKAPDFVAPGYFNGKFVSVKLSDYAGKWVVLCFYPGDFTFV